ncbi:hypothetical protein LEP1GSC195_1232 [Leptospira wolbachii serovar Codice str. CDC]|uniref:Uncharacterized protein n=1 Tax=Leptospira wolbachii serovar Codice str. CDC TaxID=1218599 RepID=R9A7K6_9LEPT|nr:hypothetical protein LEP1GSC195_1232 [Leptospira wolbachii serovar Codice str. CDC]
MELTPVLYLLERKEFARKEELNKITESATQTGFSFAISL